MNDKEEKTVKTRKRAISSIERLFQKGDYNQEEEEKEDEEEGEELNA